MLENRAPSPGRSPIHEDPDPVLAFAYRVDKTFLGFVIVRGEQERKQVYAVQIFSKGFTEVDRGCVRYWSFVS
jgi:hypothetical protein